MAPKKAKAKVKAKEKAVAAKSGEDESQTNELHAAFFVQVHDAVKCISEHVVFQDIALAKPLTIAQGGHQMPFDQKMALKALEKGEDSSYKCGGNLFHHDLLWLAQHRIPFNKGQITQIQNFSLPPMEPPASFPYVVTVAVDAVTEEALTPDGHWRRLSPAEPVFALLFSVAESIRENAEEAVLKKWLRVLLTIDFEILCIPDTETRYWKAVNLREKAVELGQSVRLSLRQRIFDVAGFKQTKEASLGTTLPYKKVAQMYAQHVKLASGTEDVSETFVDCACGIYRRIFSVPQCQKILEAADVTLLASNPWNKSIYSLQGLLDRAQTTENIAYALDGLLDGFAMGFVSSAEFAPSRIRDYRSSYVEVLKLKKKVAKHLLGQFLTSLSLDTRWHKEIREKLKNLETFRQNYAAYPNQEADSA